MSTTPTPDEGRYAAIAAALRDIADRLTAADADHPALVPSDYVSISILPNTRHAEGDRVATIDALALAVLGVAGGEEHPSGGSWVHHARGQVGPVEVSIHTTVTGPTPDAIAAELAALRAENRRLRAELDDDAVDADAAVTG
jgi:hypothetical protein